MHVAQLLFLLPAEIEFDFRVPHVNSINCSGHKYGLVYPGVGWVVWRNRACVDESLICELLSSSTIHSSAHDLTKATHDACPHASPILLCTHSPRGQL